MPNYEATEMRAHLNEYLKEIDDLLTTQESVDRYADFCGTLMTIHAITESLYAPQPDGSFKPLDEEHAQELREQYRSALEQARNILSAEAAGPVASRMQMIARELTPLMTSDRTALDMVDVSKTPTTLPELIGKAREQAVDLGTQGSVIAGGNMNSRQHIQIDGPDGIEDGYFTPTVNIEPRKRFSELTARLAEKYPDYAPLIDEMKQVDFNDLNWGFWTNNPYWVAKQMTDEPATTEAIRENLKARIKSNLLDGVVQEETLDKFEGRDDYLIFVDELRSGMMPIEAQVGNYLGEDALLHVREGANIDRRNVAMHRMSALLGKPDLVAEARPMTVIQNGVPVTGTFMATAQGVDVNHVKPDDPVVNYTEEVYENPAVFDDIAAMQALDFICGNTDRHMGNYLTRYAPGKDGKPTLTGLTLIDNDNCFGNGTTGGQSFMVAPENMGVIGMDFYTAMKTMSREQMSLMLRDCGLNEQEVDWAWERKEQLQAKIEEDMEFYKDKAPGYLEKDRIRVVPASEWSEYSMKKIAELFPKSTFDSVHAVPEMARQNLKNAEKIEKAREQGQQDAALRRELLGLPAEEPKPEKTAPIPVGKVVGSGLAQEPDPLNVSRDDTLKLAMPPLSGVSSVGGQMNRRYMVSWQENGVEKQGFFTPPHELDAHRMAKRVYDRFIEEYPEYEDVFRASQDHYETDSAANLLDTAKSAKELPLEEMGISPERRTELQNDEYFPRVWSKLRKQIVQELNPATALAIIGATESPNMRMDTRNVAMSDVSDALGAPDLLARSRVTQIECDGRIIDGVVMERAEGVDLPGLSSGEHPINRIAEEQIDTVYNTPEGLKSIADLQIIDYVCLNVDRNTNNMFLNFENAGTDQVRFTGLKGIDNDYSFGSFVPNADSTVRSLPALHNMQVISAEVWEKVNDPKTPEMIAEKMRKNGLSEQEIEGAQKRLDAVKEAVKGNKLRVVQKDEWAKGENTFVKLAANNMFGTVKYIAREAAEKGREWEQKSAEEKAELAPKEKKAFTKCVKVEQFGKAIQENTRLAELREQAERDFREQMKSAMQEAPAPAENIMSARELIEHLRENGRELYNKLDAADPWYHGTSKEYKQFKRSCRELVKLTEKIQRGFTGDNAAISEADGELLERKLNEIRDRNAAYQTKKQGERERGVRIAPIAERRLQAGSEVSTAVGSLQELSRISLIKQHIAKSPTAYANKYLSKTQARLSGLGGEELRKRVAETLYVKGLAKNVIEVRNKKEMKNALMPDAVKQQRESIMKNPSFQKMVNGLSDDELRNMAAEKNGEKLFDRFLNGVTKDMAESEHSRERQNKPEKIVEAAGKQDKNELKHAGP